jgi:hypothetical protein
MNPEITHSTELGALFEALAKAQGKIENALKDKSNPFFKSKYADLSSIWDACREPLSSNGLAIIQTVEGPKENMYLNTWLGHSSGQWMKSKLQLIILKHDPQSVGSAITYARRYALSALVGICADEDDDAEKAMARYNAKASAKNIQKEQEEEETAEQKENLLKHFLMSFPSDDREMIRAYLNKYSAHWKKTMSETINDYSDIEKFNKDFSKWKKKEQDSKVSMVKVA